MSDFNVANEASSLFGLTTTNGFYPQDSNSDENSEEAIALTKIGDLGCHNEFNKGADVRNRYKYCGTALSTGLGSLLTTFGGVIGTGAAAIVVTELTIEFPGGSQQAEITVAGHKHNTNNHSATTNAPRTFDVSAAVPGAAGLGVPNLLGGTVVNTSCSPVRATLNFSLTHMDVENASGEHFVGENRTAMCEATIDFEGVCGAASGISAGWYQGQRTLDDSNEALDTSALRAHRWFDAT